MQLKNFFINTIIQIFMNGLPKRYKEAASLHDKLIKIILENRKIYSISIHYFCFFFFI